MPTEKELDRALKSALEDSAEFRTWLVSQTKFKGASSEHVLSRANHPWCYVYLEVPNKETGETESLRLAGETDVLFVFSTSDGRKLGIHIENKLGSGRFTRLQPELYEARARYWVLNPKYGNYEDWDTVLLAPDRFIERYPADAKKFGTVISHKDVARYVKEFAYEQVSGQSAKV